MPVEAASAVVREQVAAVDPELVVYNLQTLEERLAPGVQIAIAWLSGALGLLGVFLGAIGTYGLVSWSTYERRRELAIRIALGASRSSIVRLTTAQGTKWAVTGVVIGFVVFLGGTELLQSFLRGVSAFDPISFAAVTAVVLGVAHVACFLPARRVSGCDPATTLRE
jgi:putative ABC transport system permease protein